MALALGKLTILVGAGIVGSVLANDGRMPGFSDILSGALKVVQKLNSSGESPKSNARPQNDSLRKQVTSLQEELQLLMKSRPVTIVRTTGSGSSKYGVVIVVVVVGYGYIWWKGWRFSDMMFATRRGLSDACTSVSKQLETVYSSISSTKRFLSTRIDRVDSRIDECADNTAATREEVSELRGELQTVGVNVQTVHHVVKSLETKISRIEGKQNETNFGVGNLIAFVQSIENSRTTEQIEAMPSRPALELPPLSPSSRAVSLPTSSSQEPPSPSAFHGSHKRPLQSAASASGLKELYGTSDDESSQSCREASSVVNESGETPSDVRRSNFFGQKFSGITASFLRSRSSLQASK